MIQGVIFDLGSTLIRFTGEWPQVFSHSLDVLVDQLDRAGVFFDHAQFKRVFESALAEYHQQRDVDLVERTTEVVLMKTLKEISGRSPPRPVIKLALEEMYHVSQEHWDILPSTHEVLEELEARELRLGLISNASDQSDVERLIDKAGIRRFFDPILISAGFGLRKPHPDIFKAVLQKWQLTADRVVMIGDLLEADILGAEKVGMRHIWMTEVVDHEQVQPPYPVEPEAIAAQLAEIPDILDSMDKK